MSVLLGLAANPPNRPPAAKGVDSKTLVIYSDQRTAYSLGDALELLRMQLLRVDTVVETVPLAEATPEKLAKADYLVVFCPQSAPALTTNFLQAIAEATQPVLWVGFGADRLDDLSPFKTHFQVSAFSAPDVATNVNYRGRDWKAPVSPWIQATLSANSKAKTVMTLRDSAEPSAPGRPLCWRFANFTFFAAVPTAGPIGFLFEDLLLDFYQVKEIPASRLFIRIEDYHGRSDHSQFERMADYLYSRHAPFLIAVLPASVDPETGKAEDSCAEPDFITALKYAQQRGGRIVLKGLTWNEGKAEFWNTEQDRPLAEERPEKVRERLQQVVRRMLQQGLFPLAWETPHYAASRNAYAEIAGVFSTAVEQVQTSDSTHLEKSVMASLTLDRFGRLIVPENLGYALDAVASSSGGIQALGDVITSLRGSIGGCSFSAYQPLPKLTKLMDAMGSFQTPYLDLADLDNVVQLPDALLLTGQAQRTVTLRNAEVRWKAFNRSGKLLAEEREPAKSSGPRLLKRRGAGDYELFEFSETNR